MCKIIAVKNNKKCSPIFQKTTYVERKLRKQMRITIQEKTLQKIEMDRPHPKERTKVVLKESDLFWQILVSAC